MIISMVLGLIISIALLITGMKNNNANLINLGYSFLVGIITGILSSITITLYFRGKDKKTIKDNIELLKRKSELMEQNNWLEEIVKVYTEIVLALQAYIYTNPDFKTQNGYFELCKIILNRPMSSVCKENVVTEEESDYIVKSLIRLRRIEDIIINKSFDNIDMKNEFGECLKFTSNSMNICGRIQIELNEIEAKIK